MKKSKIIVMMFIVAAVLLCVGNVAFATAPDVSGLSFSQDAKIFSIGEKGLGVVAYICYGAAVIILLVMGVEFMFASPEGKANIKKRSIAYSIGGLILFAAGTIVQIVQGVTKATISS